MHQLSKILWFIHATVYSACYESYFRSDIENVPVNLLYMYDPLFKDKNSFEFAHTHIFCFVLKFYRSVNSNVMSNQSVSGKPPRGS